MKSIQKRHPIGITILEKIVLGGMFAVGGLCLLLLLLPILSVFQVFIFGE